MVKVECKPLQLIILVAMSFLFALSMDNMAYSARSADNTYSVEVESALTVNVSANSVTLRLNPTSKPFDYGDLNVSVTTNHVTGYKLTMNSASTSLVEEDDSSLTIPTLADLAGGYTDATFTANRWGYKVGTTGNYIPFVSGSKIASSDGPISNDTTMIRLAAKIDGTQTSGTYSDTLSFTATANPLTPSLQGYKASSCTTTPSVVVDTRDNQEYTVVRLADGQCWMEQNLNLGAMEVIADLSSDNTNMTSTAATIPAVTFNNTWVKTNNTPSQVATSPDVIPVTASNSSTRSATDSLNGEPFGSLYNYCAATAGTICKTSTTDDATSDLCPKGWRLPIGGPDTNPDNDFVKLKAVYNNGASAHAAIANHGAAFAFAGNFTYAAPTNQGAYGYYWTSTHYDGSQVYRPYLGSSSFSASARANRIYGGSIRCILKE